MAQKRNPVSLRLQTRLQGHEKHFASCWFTDSFFSKVYTNDLVKRLYLGHLLQKGGSWYGEVSESRVPETCISIQFSYRKCSIMSVVLDKRKEEYLFSTSGPTKQSLARPRREGISLLSRIEQTYSNVESQTDGKKQLSLNGKNSFSLLQPNPQERALLRNRDNLLYFCRGVYASLLSLHFKEDVLTDKIVYQSIANSFGGMIATYKHPAVALQERGRASGLAITVTEKWKDLSRKKAFCHYNIVPHSPYLSTIESICNLPQVGVNKRSTYVRAPQIHSHKSYPQQISSEDIKDHFSNRSSDLVTTAVKRTTEIPLNLSSHWTSLSLLRGVSACQNVELCLYSVLFLCKKRFSFLKIKELVFKMLASNPTVRGARLVYSGRQGGRSKSAMRAKKQSALWGETALSLFSSRLAFASTGVDTSFGQIGIKLWICYK